MNTFPFEMMYQEPTSKQSKKVFVYSFLHETIETFETLALCWAPSSESWITVPVAFLKPIMDKKYKKLNEAKLDE